MSTVGVGGDAHLGRHRLHRFLTWCVDSQIPELLTLAATFDTWWTEINAFLTTAITTARSDGYKRLVKQVNPVSCWFRDQEPGPPDTIPLHRQTRSATQTLC